MRVQSSHPVQYTTNYRASVGCQKNLKGMANKIKVKSSHEERMNWAGCFPHPVEDSDIFNRMSPFRQAKIRATHELIRSNPNARLFLIYDPATRQPYPGQVLYSDIEKKLKASYSSLPEVPSGYQFSVPQGVSRRVFSYCYATAPTQAEVHRILLAFEAHVTYERLIEACTHDQRLLSNKPVDGVFAFIWRLALYMSGTSPSIPATAFIDLMDGVSQLTHLRVDIGRVDVLMTFLKNRAEELVDAVGNNRHAGALRWAQATGVTR